MIKQSHWPSMLKTTKIAPIPADICPVSSASGSWSAWASRLGWWTERSVPSPPRSFPSHTFPSQPGTNGGSQTPDTGPEASGCRRLLENTEKVLEYLAHGKKVYHLYNCIKHVPMAKPSSVKAAPTLFFLFSFSLQLMECSTKFTVCEGEERWT